MSLGHAPSALTLLCIVVPMTNYGSWEEMQLDEEVAGIAYFLGRLYPTTNDLQVTSFGFFVSYLQPDRFMTLQTWLFFCLRLWYSLRHNICKELNYLAREGGL
jgi:hypothetical protein